MQDETKKIAIASLAGSAGKTLIATQLLHPHMPDALILCVDQANTTAADFGIKNCQKHSGDEFNRTYRSLISEPGDVIVDVGGSKECTEFLAGMLAVDGSDEVTHFIVPARPNSKDQESALDTIERLQLGGVDPDKIKVIFTDVRKSVVDEFPQLIQGMVENGLEPDLDLMIAHSALFDEMIELRLLISDIVADKTNYAEMSKNRPTGDDTDYVGRHIRQRMAVKTVWPNLQAVYSKLFPGG